MIQIVWKQKHQSGHGTCDKKILTPPSIRICPLFGELKKGDYFYPPPSHMDQCLLLSNFFFFECIPKIISESSPVQIRKFSLKNYIDVYNNV